MRVMPLRAVAARRGGDGGASPPSPPRLSGLPALRNQHQLADRLPRFHEAMRLGRLSQRVRLPDKHLQLPFLHQLETRLGPLAHQIVLGGSREQHEAAYLGRLRKETPYVELVRRTSRAAVQNQMAERREALETLLESRLADSVENQIDALAAGEFHGLVREIMRFVIDHLVGAILLRDRDLAVVRYGSDHPSAGRFGDLHRDDSDTARRRMDQHSLAGGRIMGSEEHEPGGERLDRKRRSFLEAYEVGQRDYLVRVK